MCSHSLDAAKKRKPKPKVRPLFGWVGIVHEGEIDLDPMEPYGRLYRTKKEAAALYNRVRRVVVKPL